MDPETFSNYLTLLSNYRNLCAHEDILYDHTTQRTIPDNKFHSFLDIPMVDDEYIYGKNDLFSLVIILKYMLTTDEFSLMIDEIKREVDVLDDKVSTVPLDAILNKIGFPSNWYDIKKLD